MGEKGRKDRRREEPRMREKGRREGRKIREGRSTPSCLGHPRMGQGGEGLRLKRGS